MNPIIRTKGVCDPHIHIFEGKAYLYAAHDGAAFLGEGLNHVKGIQFFSKKVN